MGYSIRPMQKGDFEAVLEIFNHYVEHSLGTFPEHQLPLHVFEVFLNPSEGYPRGVLVDGAGRVAGFGMLRPYHPLPVFNRTAELTHYLAPGHTGKGQGKKLLAFLEEGARKKGIASILVPISSLNPETLRFHAANGFVECGRFKEAGMKKGTLFDTIWMQKMLS